MLPYICWLINMISYKMTFYIPYMAEQSGRNAIIMLKQYFWPGHHSLSVL